MSERRDETRYAAEVGPDALERQRAEARVRCVLCWAPAGEAHTETCPSRPAEEPALVVEQAEALF